MKILILSTMYPSSKVYFSGVFVHEQVKALKKEGINLTVVSPVPYASKILTLFSKKWKNYSSISDLEELEGITIYRPKYIALPRGFLKNLWGYPYVYLLKKYFKKKNIPFEFDLIHAHGSLPNDHGAYLISKKLDIPYLVTVHGDTVYVLTKYPSRFKTSKKVLLNASAIITVSSQVSKRVEKYVIDKKKIVTILNGFNPIDYDIQKSKQTNDKLMILFVATLIERKGCEFLIKAFSQIYEKYENVQLVIGGGGQLLEKMINLSKDLGISNRVIFKGTITHKKVIELMMQCDIFALPSWDEAFGVVYLEAMSLKKPIIATEEEGIADVVTDGLNGFLVKPKDVSSIITKLIPLIEDEELRREIGIKGYEKIKNLTWQNNALNTIEVYKKCITNDIKI